MPDLFVPLDVNFQDDDKLLAVSAAAELVYIRAMALSKRLLSDGYIAPSHLRRLCDKLDDRPEDLADELVDRGLLAPLDGGYRIVAWMKHNKPADEIREASENGRRGSLIRWHNEGKHDDQSADGCPKCEKASPPSSPPSSPLDGPPIGGADAHSRDRDIVETEQEGASDRFPTRSADGKSYTSTVAGWAIDNGYDPPDTNRRSDAYRWALEVTADNLDPNGTTGRRCFTTVIREMAETICEDDLEPSAVRQLKQLVNNYGGPTTLRVIAQALDQGAGLDPEYEGDPRAVVKYAAAILRNERKAYA